ncbi:PTPA-CTERM sorting domain-containing protein [Leptothoe spongobia]|uniref:PTPA-CTERM sorting domain-containing protein n=1 Tax=Leptothoe spongobia TAU-MAC 1115 TaxID=1967444 RepID=A0A947DF09_9CYAN|nr:PTPA-CTERM sorting domain-containing protein [Leptothoe spongobia]MBT9314706.1 PTPA-CTERM sorting domain-containing protein [Leptothoe spongobia TAU-MAC 1115]
MKVTFCTTKFVSQSAPSLGAAMLGMIAILGFSDSAVAANIGRGSDYLVTPRGSSFFDFGGPIGLVSFEGKPLGIGNSNADTVIQRKKDAIFDYDADGIIDPMVMFDHDGDGIKESSESDTVSIPIEMTRLALQSVNPVDVSGTLFDVSVGLTPETNSVGTMTINHNINPDNSFNDTGDSQGTFTSVLKKIFFDATFTPVGGGPGEFTESLIVNDFINVGADWSHQPLGSNPILVTGPLGNQDANCHVGFVSSGVPPCDETDFFTSLAMHTKNDLSQGEIIAHTTESSQCSPGENCIQPVPTPALLPGLLGLIGGALRKRKQETV